VTPLLVLRRARPDGRSPIVGIDHGHNDRDCFRRVGDPRSPRRDILAGTKCLLGATLPRHFVHRSRNPSLEKEQQIYATSRLLADRLATLVNEQIDRDAGIWFPPLGTFDTTRGRF
jgi:hypothetical protein